MPIDTPNQLREHLALAMRVELATIPPYLYALYSIEDQDSDAAGLIKSIATEEMLHAALVTNLLLAVGGEPDFLGPGLVPTYPAPMLHHRPELILHLAPVSEAHIRDTFLVIERPEAVNAIPEPDEYETLGQFYAAIEQAIERLDAAASLFRNPRASRQVANPSYYGPVKFDSEASGGLTLVHNVASARAAIEVIVHQGEGVSDTRWADPTHQELTHYAKLLEIVEGTSPIGAVRTARVDPRGESYPPEIRLVSDLFNGTYRATFYILDALTSPNPKQDPLIDRLYLLMSGVLAPLARYLMQQSFPDGSVAGPTFEHYDLGSDPGATLKQLALHVAEVHPDLADAVAPLIAGGIVPVLTPGQG
jgi:rubrerythrin